jgi:hypothetical protein
MMFSRYPLTTGWMNAVCWLSIVVGMNSGMFR